jgi:hypothetical protein
MATSLTVQSDQRTTRAQTHQITTQKRVPGKRTSKETPGETMSTVEQQAGITISFDIERVNPTV